MVNLVGVVVDSLALKERSSEPTPAKCNAYGILTVAKNEL